MRATPVMTLYNPVASNNEIRNITGGNDWSASVATLNLNANGFNASGTTNIGSNSSQVSGVHWIADARMGIV